MPNFNLSREARFWFCFPWNAQIMTNWKHNEMEKMQALSMQKLFLVTIVSLCALSSLSWILFHKWTFCLFYCWQSIYWWNPACQELSSIAQQCWWHSLGPTHYYVRISPQCPSFVPLEAFSRSSVLPPSFYSCWSLLPLIKGYSGSQDSRTFEEIERKSGSLAEKFSQRK